MAIDIAEYHEELFQEVHSRADAEGRYVEDAFFDVLTESLIDAGEIETADRVHYVSPRGIRVDGYGGDPNHLRLGAEPDHHRLQPVR